jgi:hypothetical protein
MLRSSVDTGRDIETFSSKPENTEQLISLQERPETLGASIITKPTASVAQTSDDINLPTLVSQTHLYAPTTVRTLDRWMFIKSLKTRR